MMENSLWPATPQYQSSADVSLELQHGVLNQPLPLPGSPDVAKKDWEQQQRFLEHENGGIQFP